MTWSSIPLNPSRRMLRQFAAAWLVFFAALALRQILARHHPTDGLVLAGIALIGVLGLLLPRSIRWLFIGATVLTFPIGWVMSQLVLAFMFFVIVTPIALFFRLRQRDELKLKVSDKESYWVHREKPPEPARYLKQY